MVSFYLKEIIYFELGQKLREEIFCDQPDEDYEVSPPNRALVEAGIDLDIVNELVENLIYS